MDPDACCDPEYRYARTDAVYRWRLARLMARRWPGSMAVAPLPAWFPANAKDRFTSAAPEEIEHMLGRCLPELVGWGVWGGGRQGVSLHP
jgi:hypothetical protein